MEKIDAYQCLQCKTIHATEKDCKKCERRCKSLANSVKKRKEIEAALIYDRNYPRLNATSIDNLCILIEAAVLKIHKVDINVKMSVSRFNYSNGITRLTGKITYTIKSKTTKRKFFSSWAFDNKCIAGIEPCNGGEIDRATFRYGITLHSEEFPRLKEEYARLDSLIEANKVQSEADDSLVSTIMETDCEAIDIDAKLIEAEAALKAAFDTVSKFKAARNARKEEIHKRVSKKSERDCIIADLTAVLSNSCKAT